MFSQFLGCLDAVALALGRAGLSYGRLQGGMSLGERRSLLTAFEAPAGPAVLLVSTRAGGVGLSLTAASRVYLMDLWWNAAVDHQAMQRVHRIGRLSVAACLSVCEAVWEALVLMHSRVRGPMARAGQTRPVTVVRFLCDDTIEQHILRMQVPGCRGFARECHDVVVCARACVRVWFHVCMYLCSHANANVVCVGASRACRSARTGLGRRRCGG